MTWHSALIIALRQHPLDSAEIPRMLYDAEGVPHWVECAHPDSGPTLCTEHPTRRPFSPQGEPYRLTRVAP